MARKKYATSNEEFDKRFDQGEDIHDLIDISKSPIELQGKKIRVTLDISETLVRDIDAIRSARSRHPFPALFDRDSHC